MAALVWLGSVGLFAALLALARALGLRVLAVGVPALLLAAPASAPINAEFAQDADIYRVETLGPHGRRSAPSVVAIARGARARRPAGGRGRRASCSARRAGTHLIPVVVIGIFVVWYTAASIVVTAAGATGLAPDRPRRPALTALVTVVIWLAVLAASGGDLGFQRAREGGGYPGFPVDARPDEDVRGHQALAPPGAALGMGDPARAGRRGGGLERLRRRPG